MLTVKVAKPARKDIASALRHSENEFGLAARERYKALIDQAINDIAKDPARPGVLSIVDIKEGYLLYHLRMSRRNVSGDRVGKPRHFFLFRLENADNLIIARLLHDRMLLTQHVNQLPV